ncbi:MAG: hypothetical protein HY039_12520 [Nitrospirae bacterium]|nr:hypothetical protein [Nitrospirota bacterium]
MKNAPAPLKVMFVALFTLLAGFGSALASTADTTPREENIQTIRSFLGEETVHAGLLKNGISAEQVEVVKENLDLLSDSQIQTLSMNLDRPEARPEESPAPGDAAGGGIESSDWGKDAGYKALFLILIALVIIAAIMFPTFPQLLPLLGA